MKVLLLVLTVTVAFCMIVWGASPTAGKLSVLPPSKALNLNPVPATPRHTGAGLDVPGESCANPIIITGPLPVTVTGNTTGMADDHNPICEYGGGSAPDMAYHYTPAADQLVTVDLCQSGYDTKVGVYDASDVAPGHEIYCNDDGCWNDAGNATWRSILHCIRLTGGVTYCIVVDGYLDDSGEFTMILSECPPCPPPPNSNCANAGPAVPLPATFTGDNSCATRECPQLLHMIGQAVGEGETWHAFYINEPCDVVVDNCGVPPTWGLHWVFLDNGCPCESYTVYNAGNYSECANGQLSAYYYALPAGTWYVPVLRSEGHHAVGPYEIHVRCAPLPTGRCCYGSDPMNPSCAMTLEAECQALQGNWMRDYTCDYPCPVPQVCHCTEPMDGRWCNMVGGPINDGSNNQFTVNVPAQYHITDMNVCLDLTHTFDGDLWIYIISPSGTAVALSARNGGSGDNYLCTTFDDEALIPIAFGTPPYEGSFIPDDPLSSVDGENAMGDWTLGVWDVAAGDVGVLNWVCFDFTYDYILAVELNSFEAVPGDGQVTLNWSTASETDNDHFEIVRDGHVAASHVPATNRPSGARYSWTDRDLQNGRTYTYELVAVDLGGVRTTLASTEATPAGNTAEVISEYALRQNYPNPFNPKTSISFDLAASGFVKLTAYNPMGQQVAAVVSGQMNAGSHSVTFDASHLPSGMYLYRLEVNGFSATKKMLLMK